jgi:hypothetical protein
MSDREFSDNQIFQHSGKGIPLFMAGHKNCLQANYLLGPGPRLIKKRIYRAAVSQRLRNTAYSLLLLGYKPVQHVTVLNTVGNCNTMVSVII